MIIRPMTPQRGDEIATLIFYREPGVQRLMEKRVVDIPQLDPSLSLRPGEYRLAASARAGEWVKVAFDDAGREGWLEMQRYWEYTPWDSYLKGRGVKLLQGLKKEYYELLKEPQDYSPLLSTLAKEKNLRIIQIKGDWAMAIVDLTSFGWFRWRDRDGRFLIMVQE